MLIFYEKVKKRVKKVTPLRTPSPCPTPQGARNVPVPHPEPQATEEKENAPPPKPAFQTPAGALQLPAVRPAGKNYQLSIS